ncbi:MULTISPECIES: toluene hydroxylase [Gordonia]|uniref:toluene hydroxylase n=1 Tax=Gordonia TaxID=2053 RepID=UPI00257E7A80|nr:MULTISPECIES: toluene hydroxylase [Gordonia]
MSAPAQSRERSFPTIEFTDAEAGAREFPSSRSRKYNYYQPSKKRATIYEDVTVDVQPDPERHLTQGWIYLQNAKRARAYDGWNSAWLKFIERNLGAWMHAESGMGLHVFTSIQRSAPTNMINNAVCVNAAHKLRFAQDLALFNLDLSEAEEAFDGSAHKEVWQSAPEWQPTREAVERLTAIGDWAELLFCSNIVFEQLVGSLFRSELVTQVAARNGDYITPTIVGTGEYDYDRDLNYSRALFQMLSRDEKYGIDNRKLFSRWMSEWVPRSLDAARALQPIWSQPADKSVTFSSSLEHAKTKFADVLTAMDVDIPEELNK